MSENHSNTDKAEYTHFKYGNSFLAAAFGAAVGAGVAVGLGAGFLMPYFAGIAGAALGRLTYRCIHNNAKIEGEALKGSVHAVPTDPFSIVMFGDDIAIALVALTVMATVGYGTIGPIYDAYQYACGPEYKVPRTRIVGSAPK